jgi:hypothetical protein
MSFDRNNYSSGADTFGFDGATISLAGGDYTVGNTVKAIVVAATGDVVFRPVDADADITMTALPAGYIIPYHCLAIRQTGTTATLATIIGRP